MGLSFNCARFLLCEGDDDKAVLQAIIKSRSLPDFQVCHAAEWNGGSPGGRSGFIKALDGIEPLSGFNDLKAILIVTDNDVLGQAFAEAQECLIRNGFNAPANPDGIGDVKGKPVMILLIPSANQEGDLELLSLPAIHEKWPKARCCVRWFLRCTGAAKWTKKSSINKARARAATVGFNEDDPFKGVGHLFRNGTLSAKHPCFDEVANFLQTFDGKVGI